MNYTLESVREKLSENMPSLSPTAAKIIELANDIRCSPSELTQVIKLDPVLTIKVLKLVNSPYFGLSSKVTSLEKAVILAGINTIKNLVLAAAVLAGLDTSSKPSAFDLQSFWKHSVGVGVLSKLLALQQRIDKKEAESFFLAGLLHDIGLLVESRMFPEEMNRIMVPCLFLGLVDSEENALNGLNHCLIGEVLAVHWGLAQDLISVIARHHHLESFALESPLVRTVILANQMAHQHEVGLVLDRVCTEMYPSLFASLNLTLDCEKSIMAQFDTELNKAMEIIKV